MAITPTVFVGLSGGVDSSVAALRLKQQGYRVVGVFIRVWHPEWLVCNWEAERLDAMRVAARLKIPFLTCDARDAYKNDVADYFIREYTAGRTPNPDVMCNRHVKFGAFLHFAVANGADYIATGHYAQRIDEGQEVTLHRGQDANKDQTYFLWTVTQPQLQKTLFPIGDTPKASIRAEAEAAGLLTAEKPDSQGICFLGHIDIPNFLSHYVDLTDGDVVDETGNVIGTHQGALVYTIGQRHGFTITTPNTARKPHFVIERDIDKNTITVSETKPTLEMADEICLTGVILNSRTLIVGEEISIVNRYRQTPVPAIVARICGDEVCLKPQALSDAISYGQSCVLYDGAQCLGGGIISECQSQS